MGSKVYVIAEAGVNHNGSLEMARELVEAAANAGADAVKFQTFRADLVACRVAPKAEYQLKSTNVEESQNEMLRRLELSAAHHFVLRDLCSQRGIDFISSPFDEESCRFLANELSLDILKIASGEIT